MNVYTHTPLLVTDLELTHCAEAQLLMVTVTSAVREVPVALLEPSGVMKQSGHWLPSQAVAEDTS
jgi:hypothetical protein